MYCSNCGKQNSNVNKFCKYCGNKISDPSNKSKAQNYRRASPKLHERYKNTGNLSMVVGVLGFIVAMLVGFKLDNVITDVVVALVFNAPFFYFGKRLKDHGVNDLNYALKISRGMFILVVVFIIVNSLFGGIGWLFFFLAYYYYKSLKETKIALTGN